MKIAKRRTCWLAMGVLVLGLSAGCGDDDGDTNGNNNNAEPQPFEVVEVVPDDGTQDVYLDQTVRITFSQPLDSSTVDASSVRVTADGEDATGRLLPDGQVLMFIPAQLKANAQYTVTVSGDVLDMSGVALGSDFTSTFMTSNVTIDGSAPPDPTTSAPFKHSSFVYLSRQMEYVLVGADYDGTAQNLYAIDPLEFNTTDPAPTEEIMHASSDLSFASALRKQGVSGNIDDDLEDEVVVLTHPPTGPGTLRVFDNDGGTFHVDTLDASLMINGELGGAYNYDLVMGDVDQDGYNEIVIVGVNEQRDAYLWILDDQRFGYATLLAFDVPGVLDGGNWSGVSAIEVGVGNIDDDRENEVIIAMQAAACPMLHVAVLQNLTQTFEELNVFPLSTAGYCNADTRLRLNVGDLNGDGRADLGISTHQLVDGGGTCTAGYHLDALTWDGSTFVTLGTQEVSGSVVHTGACTDNYPAEAVAFTIDVDADHLQMAELLLENHLWKWNTNTEEFEQMAHQLSLFASDGTGAMSVAVGDVNGDGLEDIIRSCADGAIRAIGLNRVLIGYDLEQNPIYDFAWEEIDERFGGGPTGQTGSLLVPANLDGDSAVVEPNFVDPDDPGGPAGRTVEHRIVFSNDVIIAVLAAPPCYLEDWQGTNDCSTGLGLSTGGTITAGASFSVFAGVSIGTEVEASAGVFVSTTIAKAEASVKVEMEASVYGSLSVGMEQTITDYAGAGEDLVIFYTVPHHQFIYTWASHPDPTVQGTAMTVNIPMRPRIFAVSREYYNANNGDQADIDETVLANVPGDLDSYPSFADVPGILASNIPLGFTAPPVTVNQGSGFKELELVLSGEATIGGSVSLTTEVEGKVCAGPVCAGANAGFTVSAFAEATFSSATIFSSSVGSIEGDYWADHLYEYGLFAYLSLMYDAVGNHVPFVVVNYYVD